MPLPNTPKQATEQRQASMVSAALALAAQHSPARVTTAALARAVGLSQGAVFRHFESKEAIRLAVIDFAHQVLLARLQTAAQSHVQPLTALRAVFMAHVDFVVEQPGVPRVIFQEMQHPEDTATEGARARADAGLPLAGHPTAAAGAGGGAAGARHRKTRIHGFWLSSSDYVVAINHIQRNLNGQWTTPQVVNNTLDSYINYHPAVDSSGKLHLFFTRRLSNTNTNALYYITRQTNSWSSPSKLSINDYCDVDDYLTNVQVGSDGTVYLVWIEKISGLPFLYYRERHPVSGWQAAKRLAPEFTIAYNYFSQMKMLIDESDNLYLFGQSFGINEGLYLLEKRANLSWLPPTKLNIPGYDFFIKHIPLSQILGILQRYKLASQELNGRQTWISTKATLSGPVEDLRRSPMEVRDLRLEGDIGDVKVDQIKIQSLEPFKYSPIHVQIDELKIGKLLILLNRPAHSNTLGELGTFSGRAEIQSENKILLRGEHSGLEFVFSSRGQRPLQVVDRMVGENQYLGNKRNFAVQTRIEPQAGNFIGQIRMTADRDFQNLELKAQVDEVVLDPKVQSLMTNGGEIGPLSLDIDAHMSSGKLTQLKGLARLDDLSVEGLSLDKVKTSFNWSHDELQAHTMVKSAQIESNSSVGRVLKDVRADEARAASH